MGRVGRGVVLALFALFAGVLLARPLLSNPAYVGLLEGELAGEQTLLYLPLVLVTVLLVAARLRSVADDGRSVEETQPSGRERRNGSTSRTNGDAQPDLLSGQGGTRNRSFEIEEGEPDAALRDHLEHLRAEFADDEEMASELEVLEEVAEAEDRPIPKRCPREYCDAIWSERTVLGIKGGNYEELDGDRVRCLGCEEIVRLD